MTCQFEEIYHEPEGVWVPQKISLKKSRYDVNKSTFSNNEKRVLSNFSWGYLCEVSSKSAPRCGYKRLWETHRQTHRQTDAQTGLFLGGYIFSNEITEYRKLKRAVFSFFASFFTKQKWLHNNKSPSQWSKTTQCLTNRLTRKRNIYFTILKPHCSITLSLGRYKQTTKSGYGGKHSAGHIIDFLHNKYFTSRYD